MEGPRTHIVGTVGLVTAMAQMRIARTNILSAVAHMHSDKMKKIRGHVKTKKDMRRKKQVTSGIRAPRQKLVGILDKLWRQK